MSIAANRRAPVALYFFLLAAPAGWFADRIITNDPAPIAHIQHRAEHAIMIGGILIERHRHVAAGVAEGCALGAVAGGIGGAVIGLATGGTALALLPTFVSIGCGLGAAAGATVAYPLDDYLLEM